MKDRLHLVALQVYRRLPRGVRRRIVRWASPSYTVGAICVIERPNGALLLVRQSYRSNWGIPGGLLRRGEDPATGARREVFEEVGLAIDLVGEPAVVVDADAQRVDLIFRARPVSHAELEHLQARSPEIEDLGWFPPDQLPKLQFETAGALVALARSSASPQAVPLLP